MTCELLKTNLVDNLGSLVAIKVKINRAYNMMDLYKNKTSY